MNGPIAQSVALTCFGNAFLQGRSGPEFFPSNSTCQFCDRVTFVEFRKPFIGKPKQVPVAENPSEWFSLLKQKQATGIGLTRDPGDDPNLSDRMSSGFVGGGGTWRMNVSLPHGRSESWFSRWEVGNQQAPERRIWRVTYGGVFTGKQPKTASANLMEVADRLLKALREIHTFSEQRDCAGFTDCFAKAIASLTKGERHGYHKDLAPPGLLDSKAEAILDAAQSAWVFGGMGSWNDIGFEGAAQTEYERVSDQLFQSVTESIAAATSSSFQAN